MWKTVKLGEICNFEGGSQPPKKEFVYEPADGYVRFLQIRDFKSDKNRTYIPIAKKNRLCGEADILIGRYGASVGQILSGLSGAYNVALMKTIPNENLISQGWLHAYLTSPLFQKPLMEVSSRSAQNGFSKDDIYDFDVPLPPLSEQQRIVAKLDAAFAEIDKAIEITEAKEAETKELQATFLSASLNEEAVSWKTVQLSDVCELAYGKALDKSDRLDGDGVPAFGANGIKTYAKKSLFDEPSIIVGRKGSAGELNKVVAPFWALDVTYYTKIKKEIITLDFLFYVLKTLNLPSMARGVKPGINRNDVYNMNIILPPIDEQKNIVTKLDTAFAEIEAAHIVIKKKKENCKALKSAILLRELQSGAA